MFVKDVIMVACRELGLDEVIDEIKAVKLANTPSVAGQSANELVIAQTEGGENQESPVIVQSVNGESENTKNESGKSEDAESENTKSEFSDGVKKEIEKLIESINLAVETITSSEVSLVAEEKITSDAEGKVSLDAFSKGVYEVFDVFGENSGESVDFMLMPFHLYLPQKNTNYLVKFRAGSKRVSGLDDQIEVAPFIGVGVLARAVVYEYLLSKNCYSEATFWKESFEDALEKVKIKNRKYRFKSRGIM